MAELKSNKKKVKITFLSARYTRVLNARARKGGKENLSVNLHKIR